MQRGFGLIEIVLGASIISLAFLAVLAVTFNALRYVDHALRETEAAFLLEEGGEALRSMRDTDWSLIAGLAPETTYTLSFVTGANARWATSTTPILIDGIFDRTFAAFPVYRDGSDRIAESGTLDAGTRRLRIDVSWQEPKGTTTRSVELFLSDI